MNMREFSIYISETKLLGILPLDGVLHFLIGMALTIVLLRLKINFKVTTLIVFMIQICKEIYDSQVMTATLQEHLIDTIFTMIYPSAIFIIRFIKSKIED